MILTAWKKKRNLGETSKIDKNRLICNENTGNSHRMKQLMRNRVLTDYKQCHDGSFRFRIRSSQPTSDANRIPTHYKLHS
ncbi:hypothetical protein Y032_0002g789 [Ancylostoma ceylanicum]|uniref:Uncharacterized protein n=1 Tax=Ancylostoma ceylanicum TaxID=53326 RepID=A0A016W0N5_9BILA|nr:hypothetical protein Y032_0002g789 [Ancylostoma ceylanicum]